MPEVAAPYAAERPSAKGKNDSLGLDAREERDRSETRSTDRAPMAPMTRTRPMTPMTPMTPSSPESTFLSMSLVSVEALAAELKAAGALALTVSGLEASDKTGLTTSAVLPADAARASAPLLIDGAETHATENGASLARGAANATLRLVDRGLHALLLQRGGTLIMRLSPPELGSLEVRMRFEAGRVDVLFRASGAEASRLLEGNLGMLRQSLERHGVGVGRLAVEPPEFRRAEESARTGVGESFDAGGRESQGRQEAERELRGRTESSLAATSSARSVFDIAGAPEGPSSWPSAPRPASVRTESSPAATAS